MRLFRQKKQQISRKREIRNKSKEKNMDDFLLKQIDEFRDKAQQLQDLINTKETKVRVRQQSFRWSWMSAREKPIL